MRVVNGCQCGEAHRLTEQSWRKLRDAEKRHGLAAPFGNLYRMWQVPRLYLACHAVNAVNVAGLAKLHRWPEVK